MREQVERVRDDLERQLALDGWRVTLHEMDGSFAVVLDHVLSMSYQYSFGEDPSVNEKRLREFLAHREFEVIRRRPTSLTHAPFLKNIRTMAGAMRWDPDVIAVVARSLGVHGLLPEAEAEWLEQAGPAWQA